MPSPPQLIRQIDAPGITRNLILKIKDLSSNSKWHSLFSHYLHSRRAGVQLSDPYVYPSILKACSNLSYSLGVSLHASLIKLGLDSFTSIANSLTDFYMKFGFSNSALAVFSCMPCKDCVSWNIMIHGHMHQGALYDGWCWFLKARFAGFVPNVSTMVLVIQACHYLGTVVQGHRIHGYTVQSGIFAISSVQNSLLSFYADTNIRAAQLLFDEMLVRDAISWSVMIGAYVRNEEAQHALMLFENMFSHACVPDEITVVGVLKACSYKKDINMGRLSHCIVICRGFNGDVFVGNALVDMYSKSNDAASALKVFNDMPLKNNVSWNCLLSTFVHNEKYCELLMLFDLMGKEGIEADEVTFVHLLESCKYLVDPSQCKMIHSTIVRRGCDSNGVVMNSLLDAYAKANLIELSWKLFLRMTEKDLFTWTAMVGGFAHCGKSNEAIAVFREMIQAQMQPNSVTILNLLDACSLSADIKQSKWAHGIVTRRGLSEEVAIGTAILNMYSKCGAIDASVKAFDQIPRKNVLSWSAMIAAYGMNGRAGDALALITRMKLHGCKPNAVTLLSALSACSHGGLVEEGLYIFKDMVQNLGVEPVGEHYSCIVDMLSRAGDLEITMDFILNISERFRADASLWSAFLSACRSCQSRELGERVASRVLELEPSNSAGYLLASSMYSTSGIWAEAAKMRWMAKKKGVKVVSGYSLVNIDNTTSRFTAGDASHPQAVDIRSALSRLNQCLKIDEQNPVAADA